MYIGIVYSQLHMFFAYGPYCEHREASFVSPSRCTALKSTSKTLIPNAPNFHSQLHTSRSILMHPNNNRLRLPSSPDHPLPQILIMFMLMRMMMSMTFQLFRIRFPLLILFVKAVNGMLPRGFVCFVVFGCGEMVSGRLLKY